MAHPWQYDETVQVGTDYRNSDEVRAYDERMQRLRDPGMEADEIREALRLTKDSVVWEIGTGTGECACRIARSCRQIYATDVSPVMLAYARGKAEERKIPNVIFEAGGFLSGFQPENPVDAVVSQLALHHLPDFWKFTALSGIAAKLRQNGRFFLRDVVYPSQRDDFDAFFGQAIEEIRQKAGEDFIPHTIEHIKREFSTLDWILEGMIERSGLKVIRKNVSGFLTVYVCEK